MAIESGIAENLEQSRQLFKLHIYVKQQKSLLQRARIAMVAIVAILGIGGAVAMTPSHSAALQTYGVVQTNASTYVVTAITANSRCDDADKICTVRSAATPNPVTHEIPMSGAEQVSDGQFVK